MSEVEGQRAHAVRGAVWLGASTGMNSLLQFAQIVVLAHILAPGQVGIVAILAITVSIIDMITDLGMSNALIQKRKISQSDVNAVYWFNVSIGIVLAATTFFLAGPLAASFNEPELRVSLQWIALVFLITPHGQVFRGLLERSHFFKPVGISEASGGVIAVLVTVGSALLGAGALSYVIGRIASAITKTTLFQSFGRGRGFAIGLRFSPRGALALIRFGAIQTIDTLVSFVHNNVGTIVVGKQVSVAQLGGFNLAFNLAVNLPGTINSVFTRAAFPSLSRVQGDPRRMVDGYAKLLHVTGIVNFPVLIGLALVSPELVPLLLGAKWEWTVPLVQVLALGGCVRALTSPLGAFFMARGKPEVALYVNLVRTVLVVVAVLMVASSGGPLAVAMAISATALVTLLLNIVILRVAAGLSMTKFLISILRPLLFVIPMTLGVLGIRWLANAGGWVDLVSLIVQVVIGGALYAATLILAREPLITEAVQSVKSKLGAR